MRVIVDGLVFENTYQLGIRRLFSEVMTRLADQVEFTLWLRQPPAAPLPAGASVVRDRGRVEPARWNVPERLWRRLSPPGVPAAVRTGDLFHPTYFTPCPRPGPVPVVTVYDMIAETCLPGPGGSFWAPNVAHKRAAIESAALCIAISEATAADLVRFYPHAAGKVRVVPLAGDHRVAIPAAVRNGGASERARTDAGSGASVGASADAGDGPRWPEAPFALFVGQRQDYKNFQTVLEAMRAPHWPADLALAVVGAPLAAAEWRRIYAMGLRRRVHDLGALGDGSLRQAYRVARCFIFASELEGFGLSILEAQASDCPVVCSDIVVFREVAGRAARFFEVRRGDALAEAVGELSDAAARDRLIAAGRENIRRFSWERTAAGYLAAYREALG